MATFQNARLTSREADPIVRFLCRPDTYPDAPRGVSVVETHMSWVFLTDAAVYKLKKAIRENSLDFTTSERRRRNCLEETRLNERLAPGVYRGVVAITRDAAGRLALNGDGEPVDWLVHMRRLPDAWNLDTIIREGRAAAEEAAIRVTARHLARFFADAPAAPVTVPAYLARLTAGVEADRLALSRPRYALPREKVDALVRAQLLFLDGCAELLARRVLDGRIVEGHGDLRPEHIWLDGQPAVIDRVEFDRSLRTVDPADEIAFLCLECDRLGAPVVGRWFQEVYTEVTGDAPAASLLAFYRVYRALRRAMIAARHLDDPSVADPERFLARARRYLEMVEPVTPDPGGGPP